MAGVQPQGQVAGGSSPGPGHSAHVCASLAGQLAAGTCEIVTLDRDSSQPRRTIARQTARCACRKGQIAGTTRARPACVDGESPGTPGKAVEATRGVHPMQLRTLPPPLTEHSLGSGLRLDHLVQRDSPCGQCWLVPVGVASRGSGVAGSRVPSELAELDWPKGCGPGWRGARGAAPAGRAKLGAHVSATRPLWLVPTWCDQHQAHSGCIHPSRAMRISCPAGAMGGAG